jgi:hypothetical protein
MEGSRIPLQPDRPSNVLDGILVFPGLMSDDSEEMKRVGVIRRDRENLPVDLLGSLQPPRPVVPDGNR